MNTTKRDWQEVAAMWMVIGGLFTMMLFVFLLSPAVYILGMGIIGMLAVVAVTVLAVHGLTSEGGIIGWIIAGNLISSMMDLVGAIAKGLASVSD